MRGDIGLSGLPGRAAIGRSHESLDAVDRVLSSLREDAKAFSTSSTHHAFEGLENFQQGVLELGRLIAWAAELVGASSIHAQILSALAVQIGGRGGEDFTKLSLNSHALDDDIQAFKLRVHQLAKAMEGLSWA